VQYSRHVSETEKTLEWCRILIATLLGAGSLLTALPTGAVEPTQDEIDRAVAICVEIEGPIDALADFTDTKCLPAGVAAPGGANFFLLSEKPVFSVEASKKAWILTCMGAVGFVLNDKRPTFKADEVVLSDVERMKSRTGYMVKATVLKSLQRRVKNDELDLDAAYAELLKNLRQVNVPARH
jgi:hypothetical protein